MAEFQPYITVARDIINLGEIPLDELAEEFDKANLAKKNASVFANLSCVDLMSTHDARDIFDLANVSPDEDEIEGLADFIDDWLPESAKDTLYVKPGRLFSILSRNLNSKLYYFSLEDQGQVHEREVVLDMTRQYYEEQLTGVDPDQLPRPTAPAMRIGKAKNDNFGRILEGVIASTLQRFPLPEFIELGPAFIEEA